MQERVDIMKVHARGLPLREDVHLESMAKGCHGYSGADLAAVCREAAMRAISEAVQPAPDGRALSKLASKLLGERQWCPLTAIPGMWVMHDLPDQRSLKVTVGLLCCSRRWEP